MKLKYQESQLVIFTVNGDELEGVIDFGLSGIDNCTDGMEESVYDISAHDGTITFHVVESDIVRAVEGGVTA